MFDKFVENLCKQNFKKKMKLYESSRKFQVAWTTHLPWAKSIVDDKGEVHLVKCMTCTFVVGKDKLLIPKLDNLLKHVVC